MIDIFQLARQVADECVDSEESNDGAMMFTHYNIKRFAALVAQAECDNALQWLRDNGYATGHGDTIEEILRHLEWEVADRCAKECNRMALYTGVDCAAAIRAKYCKGK